MSSRSRAFCTVLLILLAFYETGRSWNAATRGFHDFSTYYLSSLDARTGVNPYRVRTLQAPYIYPPTLLWLVGPLTHLDMRIAGVLWTWLTFVAWFLCAFWAVSGLSTHGERCPPAAYWLPSVLALRFILREFGMGQVNMMVLTALVAAFVALRRDRDRLTGVLVALAADVKILPVAFLLPLAVWRRWRALLAALIAMPLILLAPVVTYGPGPYFTICDQFVHGRLGADATNLSMDSHMANQALLATLNRYLTTVSPLAPGAAPFRMNIATYPLPTVFTGFLALALLAGVATAWALNRVRGRPDLWGVGFALVFLTTHLLSKKTWEEHLVSLLFVYAALLQFSASHSGAGRRVIGVSAVMQWIYAPMFVGNVASDHLQAYGLTTFSLLILWTYCFLALVRQGDPFGTAVAVPTAGGAAVRMGEPAGFPLPQSPGFGRIHQP